MPITSPISKTLAICGLALMLTFTLPLLAVAADDYPRPVVPDLQPPAGNGEVSAGGISVLSGGVGEDAQQEMLRSAKSFNVHVLFATRQGAYLADIPFTVTDHKGRELAASTSEGPWLYLKLPPGSYQISAQLHGASQSRKVKVSAGTAPVTVNFLFADQ